MFFDILSPSLFTFYAKFQFFSYIIFGTLLKNTLQLVNIGAKFQPNRKIKGKPIPHNIEKKIVPVCVNDSKKSLFGCKKLDIHGKQISYCPLDTQCESIGIILFELEL